MGCRGAQGRAGRIDPACPAPAVVLWPAAAGASPVYPQLRLRRRAHQVAANPRLRRLSVPGSGRGGARLLVPVVGPVRVNGPNGGSVTTSLTFPDMTIDVSAVLSSVAPEVGDKVNMIEVMASLSNEPF